MAFVVKIMGNSAAPPAWIGNTGSGSKSVAKRNEAQAFRTLNEAMLEAQAFATLLSAGADFEIERLSQHESRRFVARPQHRKSVLRAAWREVPPAMGFVVRAVTVTGEVIWIGLFRYGGYRAFGPRETAEVFKTKLEAQAEIDKLPRPLVGSGVTFTIESAKLSAS
jgi:hypothetical protein